MSLWRATAREQVQWTCESKRKPRAWASGSAWRATALAGCFALWSGAAQSASDHLIVPGERIGAADLAPADQGALTRALGAPDQIQQRGGHAIYDFGELTVDFDLDRDAPFEISTAAPAYRTRTGLGVGASEEAIRAGLGQPLCQGHDASGNGLLVYDSIWFQTLGGIAARVAIRQHLRADDFREGAAHC